MDSDSDAIGFNSPFLIGSELEYVRTAFQNHHASGDGPFTKRCAALLKAALENATVLLTPSCTAALEMAAILLNIKPGDEVIVPSFTFVSTVNAFVLRGATPVFCDIRPDTMNMDESRLEDLITARTRAILPVHYAGIGCEMEAIAPIAARHGVPIVEDNAHGLFGQYRSKPLGTFGRMATLSFHETKNFSCGEGGALIVNDPELIERALIIRDKGTNRQQFFRGQVDKYTWVDLGSSYVLSDLLAATLLAQLEAREQIMSKRRAIWNRYDQGLREWSKSVGVTCPTVPDHCEHANHMYYLVLNSLDERQQLIQHLRNLRITAAFHYTPLHLSRMGLATGRQPARCPVTERISDCLVRLPFYYDLSLDDVDRVVDAVRSLFTSSTHG
ncbi:MAG: dTDP-4-amino-4,6-dideoxygalactose transaminase [Phycisphaera sp.]|nr:dTDP-4-amino-4,6-dideoxygalactose transaminase [Phycisphaera sp.]